MIRAVQDIALAPEIGNEPGNVAADNIAIGVDIGRAIESVNQASGVRGKAAEKIDEIGNIRANDRRRPGTVMHIGVAGKIACFLLYRNTMRPGSVRHHAMTDLAFIERAGIALKGDLLKVVTGLPAGNYGVRLPMADTAEQPAVSSRFPEQLARLLGKLGTMTVGGPAGGFLKPGLTSLIDTMTDLRYAAMAILAGKTVLGTHDIPKALSVWPGMTFITIIGDFAMLFMHRL